MMFGLNAEDAMGLREDVVRLEAAAVIGRQKAQAARARSIDESFANASAAMQHQEKVILQFRQQLAEFQIANQQLANENKRLVEENKCLLAEVYEAVAVGNGASMALKDAVAELAARADLPAAGVTQTYCREIRTRRFNQQVNKMLAEGKLGTDPRILPTMANRPWYVPGLDPDHGL